MATVTINQKGVLRIRGGHPWVFRSDVLKVEGAAHGDTVKVRSQGGGLVGSAFYSQTSQITLRLLNWHTGAVKASENPASPVRARGLSGGRSESASESFPLTSVDEGFFRERIAAAAARRNRWITGREAYRLAFAESDGLPSIIVDRYGDHFVFQTLSAGADRWKEAVVGSLEALFHAKSITERNDAPSRQREDLPLASQVFRGSPEFPFVIQEGGLRFWVDPLAGQKTGLYLDQAENRVSLKRFVTGRVLDPFCYQGGFACHAATVADEVVASDIAPAQLRIAEENKVLNALTNITFEEANAFDRLRELCDRREEFDTVILDPPAFVRSRATLEAGIRGYKEINLRALKLIRPGGVLITSSCSQNLAEGLFLQILTEAAQDAERTVTLLQKTGQPPDHPVLISFPESSYLKTVVCQIS